MKQSFLENKINPLMFIFILAVLLLIFPSFIRHAQDNSIMVGEAYYDLRISNSIIEGKLLNFDSLQERTYDVNLYHLILSGLNLFMSPILIYLFVPFILGVLSLILFWLILKKFNVEKNVLFFVLFIYVLSPIFLFLFTNLNKYSIVVVLSLASFLMFLSKKPLLSILTLIFIPLIDFSSFIIILLMILIYAFLKDKLKQWNYLLIISTITTLISIFILNLSVTFEFLIKKPAFGELWTSFGALIGLSIFTLFLAFLGFASLWKKKRTFLFFNISFIMFLIISMFNDPAKIIFNFFISGLAGYAFYLLISRNWAIITIKKFTILLIFCSLIFSTSVYVNGVTSSQPNKELVDALEFLKYYEAPSLFETEVVFSHNSYGFFIEYFANKKSFLDTNSIKDDNYDLMNNVSNEIFYSRNLDDTELLLRDNNIQYFLVTDEMKKGFVWKKPDEGLLFLFQSSNKFLKIYEQPGVQIWSYSNFVI